MCSELLIITSSIHVRPSVAVFKLRFPFFCHWGCYIRRLWFGVRIYLLSWQGFIIHYLLQFVRPFLSLKFAGFRLGWDSHRLSCELCFNLFSGFLVLACTTCSGTDIYFSECTFLAFSWPAPNLGLCPPSLCGAFPFLCCIVFIKAFSLCSSQFLQGSHTPITEPLIIANNFKHRSTQKANSKNGSVREPLSQCASHCIDKVLSYIFKIAVGFSLCFPVVCSDRVCIRILPFFLSDPTVWCAGFHFSSLLQYVPKYLFQVSFLWDVCFKIFRFS